MDYEAIHPEEILTFQLFANGDLKWVWLSLRAGNRYSFCIKHSLHSFQAI